MNKRNYQKELDEITANNRKAGKTPKLLLHICCAPCASGALLELKGSFNITAYYYNPNISPESEFIKREAELKRFIKEACGGKIDTTVPLYNEAEFLAAVKGLEDEPEGGKRCSKCFELRLSAAAKYAAEQGFDYVTTTLTLSPLKDAQKLNSIGEAAAKKYGVAWLPSDFKKKEGYKKSIELSRQYGLYRQNYCGCRFSKKDEA